MKVLNIVESGYRAIVEEQDDSAIWLIHALRRAGADVTVFFRSNAVNYLVKSQQFEALAIGLRRRNGAPDVLGSIEGLMKEQVAIYADGDELRERGIREHELLPGVNIIMQSQLPELLEQHDRIWHW